MMRQINSLWGPIALREEKKEQKAVLEYSSTGTITARNLYGKGIDEIVRRWEIGSNQWYLVQQNHEGNVTHLFNYIGPSATVIEKYSYDAFGKPTIYNASGGVITTSAYGNRFLFTGREYAATFGFYEYRARAYHPGLGRFMSEDPKLFDAGDYNLFRYCHNDPLDLTDPMGWAPIEVANDVDEKSRHGLDVLHREAMASRHGMEIATSTGRENGNVFLSKEREFGKGTPYGAQKVAIPAPKPGSDKDPESGLHVHRNDIQHDANNNEVAKGTLSTKADRTWADVVKKAIYTENESGTIKERYRPDDTKNNAGVSERLNGKVWQPVDRPPPKIELRNQNKELPPVERQ